MDEPDIDVRAVRKLIGLTQAEFGERLGLDQSTISRLESGALPLDKRTSLAISALEAAHRASSGGDETVAAAA